MSMRCLWARSGRIWTRRNGVCIVMRSLAGSRCGFIRTNAACGWNVGRRDVAGRRLIGLRNLGGGMTRGARGKRNGRKVKGYGFFGFVLLARRWEKGMTERKVILSVKDGI